VLGIGIGYPDPLDAKSGTILSPPNLPGWERIPLASIVEEHFELPVKVDNDANVAAVAEAKLGAGAGYESVYYLTVSTGVGGGFVINGKVFQGANGYAGEVGNMIVVPNGRKHPSLILGHLKVWQAERPLEQPENQKGSPVGPKPCSTKRVMEMKQPRSLLMKLWITWPWQSPISLMPSILKSSYWARAQ
jgi:glucokinase